MKTMVIYEVNLSINKAIFAEYYSWLLDHIKKMLKFEGFLKAEVGIVEHQGEDEVQRIRISYSINSHANLKKYLTTHAGVMRADAIEKFGDQFSSNRRIILNPTTIE